MNTPRLSRVWAVQKNNTPWSKRWSVRYTPWSAAQRTLATGPTGQLCRFLAVLSVEAQGDSRPPRSLHGYDSTVKKWWGHASTSLMNWWSLMNTTHRPSSQVSKLQKNKHYMRMWTLFVVHQPSRRCVRDSHPQVPVHGLQPQTRACGTRRPRMFQN